MARQTKKPNKSKKSYKRQSVKIKLGADVVKRRKNLKSIHRAKEMEETHRKQKTIEDKYRTQAQRRTIDAEAAMTYEDEQHIDEEENPYETLMIELAKDSDKRPAHASDDEDEDDEDSAEEEKEELDEEEMGEDAVDEEEENMENEANTQGTEEEITDEEDEVADEDGEMNEDDKVNEEDEEGEEAEVDEELEATETQPESTKTDVNCDTFGSHLDYELPADEVEKLLAANKVKNKSTMHWPNLGDISVELPEVERPVEQQRRLAQIYDTGRSKAPTVQQSVEELQAFGVKPILAANASLPLTPRQSAMLTILHNYQDFYYPERSYEQSEELRQIYCLHALNHMLKTRSRILHHNAKLTAASQESKKQKKKKNKSSAAMIVPDSYRDQGLVRPKVLIILPFRESAYRVVNLFKQLLHGDKFKASSAKGEKSTANLIMHYERFVNEYSGQTLHFSKTNPKPEDYEQIFEGNSDDNFRIGMSLTKKCLKLYTDFYSSDILIASPLGLRMVVGAPGSKERDYDFLNSIELLIIDQAELIYAQNWENLVHVLEHLHLQPQSMRDTDFLRVRPWCLSGLSRFYRQTLLLCSHELPEFRALFNSMCANYSGNVRICNPIELGNIRNVAVPLPQTFHRVEVTDLESSYNQRFRYFINELLPRFRSPTFAHCMLYVPSYFDYVRLRNYFKAETISFVQICEYTNKAKMARARDLFFHSGVHFMLYSERSHFYRRTRVKGIRHLIMYQPPLWPHFYAEMINLMHAANQNARDALEDSMSVTVLYTKYDLLQLKTVLGSETAAQLVRMGKREHTFAAVE